MFIKRQAFAFPLATIFLGLFLLIPAWAAEGTRNLSTNAPSFWKVEGKENTLWLFGSIHVLTESHYPLANNVEAAFKASPNLVVEVDVVNADPQVLQHLVATVGMLPEGSSLRTMLGEEQYARASNLAIGSGYNLNDMGTMRPWLIAMVLAMAEYAKAGYTPAQGVENYFLTRAVTEGKSIVELETMQSQINIFVELDDKTQVAVLMQTLEQLETMDEEIIRLMAAWEEGSLDEIEEALLEEFGDYPALYRRLVTDRNHNWITQLTPMLTESGKDYFVVVGALHLVGDQGVANLLREKGFKVTRQ